MFEPLQVSLTGVGPHLSRVTHLFFVWHTFFGEHAFHPVHVLVSQVFTPLTIGPVPQVFRMLQVLPPSVPGAFGSPHWFMIGH